MNMITSAKTHQEVEQQLNSSMKVYLLFNKANGAFYNWVNYHAKHGFPENMFHVTVCESFNPSTQEILGNWDHWEVVDKVEQPTMVLEETLDKMTASEITKRASIGKQLNVISKAVLKLASFMGAEETEELHALASQLKSIEELIHTGNRRKEGYRKDPSYNFVTYAEQNAIVTKRYEGGIGEATGPREVL